MLNVKLSAKKTEYSLKGAGYLMLSTFSWENDSAWSESCRSGWRWNKLVAVDTTVVLVTSCCDCFLWCLSMEPQHSVILVMSGDRKQSSLA